MVSEWCPDGGRMAGWHPDGIRMVAGWPDGIRMVPKNSKLKNLYNFFLYPDGNRMVRMVRTVLIFSLYINW